MINNVTLVGRLTSDPTLRKTPSSASVASFTVACDRRFKTEGQPSTDFISCVCWNKLAENLSKYCHKGDLIGIEGRLQSRSYTDSVGKKVYVTEVLAHSISFLSKKSSNAQPETTNNQNEFNPDEYGNAYDLPY